MFFSLISCMFFLRVFSFVHQCLPLAVPICLQALAFSLPSIRWDFLFTWLIPSIGTSPLSHALLALLFQETQPAGKGTRWSHGSFPTRLLHPAASGRGRVLLAKTVWRHRGARYSLLPLLHAWLFAGGLGGFLRPPMCWGSSEGLMAPHGFPSTWEEARNLPAPLQKPRDQALLSPKPLRRSSRLLQGGAAAGAAGSSQNRCRDGQGNEMVDSRQGERFQNRKGGSVFTSAVGFHFSVLSVITTALASPAGRKRGSVCWAVCLRYNRAPVLWASVVNTLAQAQWGKGRMYGVVPFSSWFSTNGTKENNKTQNPSFLYNLLFCFNLFWWKNYVSVYTVLGVRCAELFLIG